MISRQLLVGQWTPFDETIEWVLRQDYHRLLASGLLADLSIEIVEEPHPNGVQGKRVVFMRRATDADDLAESQSRPPGSADSVGP